MHIHFIGICGTFMAGLARIATELGHTVSGSDTAFYPPMSDQLKSLGVTTYTGYDHADIWQQVKPDLVIVGNVCKRGMPIIESLLQHNLPYTSGPQWLGEQVLKSRHVLAVSGTHGKTTTTAMLIHILRSQGIDTGYLVGGVMQGLPHSASLGTAPYFVIEADEYDAAFFDKRPKFLHYHPDTLIIGNIEFDHADIYEDLAHIQRQFHYAVRLVPPQGTIIWGADAAVSAVKVQGTWSKSIDMNHHLASPETINADDDNNLEKVEMPPTIVGAHNITNAHHASYAATTIGIALNDATQALATFSGVKRRLECLAEINGITVYDDFAHHPTAINLTLSTLKKQSPQKRLIAVFEPRSRTMQMGVHAKPLENAFAAADDVFIYMPGDMAWDMTLNQPFHQFDAVSDLCDALLTALQPNDQVIIMSNGDFAGLHHRLISALRAKYHD